MAQNGYALETYICVRGSRIRYHNASTVAYSTPKCTLLNEYCNWVLVALFCRHHQGDLNAKHLF